MKTTQCLCCASIVEVEPILVYYNFIGYFIAMCPICDEVAYEKQL